MDVKFENVKIQLPNNWQDEVRSTSHDPAFDLLCKTRYALEQSGISKNDVNAFLAEATSGYRTDDNQGIDTLIDTVGLWVSITT
jgi:hypothetical protein